MSPPLNKSDARYAAALAVETEIEAGGGAFLVRHGQLAVAAPAGLLTPAMQSLLRDLRPELWAVLGARWYERAAALEDLLVAHDRAVCADCGRALHPKSQRCWGCVADAHHHDTEMQARTRPGDSQ